MQFRFLGVDGVRRIEPAQVPLVIQRRTCDRIRLVVANSAIGISAGSVGFGMDLLQMPTHRQLAGGYVLDRVD
jgi:hypothetical protein